MRNYFTNARGRHWLLVIILFATSAYLPYLIFGAYPFAKKVNLGQDEINNIVQELDLPDYYQLYTDQLTDAEKLLEKAAFDEWECLKFGMLHSTFTD